MSPYIQTHTHTHVCVCNYLFYVTKTVKPLSDLRLNYKVVVGARAAHMEERGSLSCQTFKYLVVESVSLARALHALSRIYSTFTVLGLISFMITFGFFEMYFRCGVSLVRSHRPVSRLCVCALFFLLA